MSRIGRYITSATSYHGNNLSSVSPLNKNVCILTSPEKNADNVFLPYNVKHISSRCCMRSWRRHSCKVGRCRKMRKSGRSWCGGSLSRPPSCSCTLSRGGSPCKGELQLIECHKKYGLEADWYLWGRPALVELTLELYFSVLYVDEEAEEPVVLRGERVVDKEEETWRAMSRSMSDNVDLLLRPEEKPPA